MPKTPPHAFWRYMRVLSKLMCFHLARFLFAVSICADSKLIETQLQSLARVVWPRPFTSMVFIYLFFQSNNSWCRQPLHFACILLLNIFAISPQIEASYISLCGTGVEVSQSGEPVAFGGRGEKQEEVCLIYFTLPG